MIYESYLGNNGATTNMTSIVGTYTYFIMDDDIRSYDEYIGRLIKKCNYKILKLGCPETYLMHDIQSFKDEGKYRIFEIKE